MTLFFGGVRRDIMTDQFNPVTVATPLSAGIVARSTGTLIGLEQAFMREIPRKDYERKSGCYCLLVIQVD